MKIYDLTGRLIKALAKVKMSQGVHQIHWNKKDEAENVTKSRYLLFAVQYRQ
jgi:flagellar hook assembly protein FlgD